MDQVGGCQAEIQGFTNNAKKAQRRLELMIGNLHHGEDHPPHNQEAEHEILNEIDEAKQRFVMEMDQNEGLHGDALNESAEIFSFRRSGYSDRHENWEGIDKDEEEKKQGELR